MEYEKPSLTADNVIIRLNNNKLEVLLINRLHEPYIDCWALPGGFVDKGETVEQAAARELEEETGITNVVPSLLGVFSRPGRDPRGWTVTAAYMILINKHVNIKAGDDAKDAKWFDISGLPELAFDHDNILLKAKEKLKEQAYVCSNFSNVLSNSLSINEIKSISKLLN